MFIDKYKAEDGSYVDKDGVDYGDGPIDFIHGSIFGFCACGSPNRVMRLIRDVMFWLEFKRNGGDLSMFRLWEKEFGEDKLDFIYYVLDKMFLTEHGGRIPGWLTDEGQELLSDLNEIFG